MSIHHDKGAKKLPVFDDLTNRPKKFGAKEEVTTGMIALRSDGTPLDGYARIYWEWKPKRPYRITRIIGYSTYMNAAIEEMSPSLLVQISETTPGVQLPATWVTIPDGFTEVDPGDGMDQYIPNTYRMIFNASSWPQADYPQNLIVKPGNTYNITAAQMYPILAEGKTWLYMDYEQLKL